VIGASVPRLEDGPLLRGRGRYVADLVQRDDLHLRVVRSEVAHGRLLRVDATEARRHAEVALVLTAVDLPASIPPIGIRLVGYPQMDPYLQPVLARDEVRYVGEPVAAVFATSAYAAEDAAELVAVELEELPVLLDPYAEPVVWDRDGHGSEVMVLEECYGGVEEAFAAAHAVVELELSVGRHTGVPLETRGARAEVEPGTGVLVIGGAAKVPHYNRDAIAAMLGLPRAAVVLHEGHVGGGFGVRGELYPEDVLVAYGARRTGRAVAWIEDRAEHLVATNHSRDQVHRIRAAVDEAGFVLALDDEFWQDQGAYVRTHGATVPTLSMTMLPGPYRVPAYRSRGHVRLTHKTPAGTYRAPGRFETTFVRERVIDAVAHRLGLDRIDVRRTNFIVAAEMPFERPLRVLGTDVVYDSGDYARLLDRLIAHVDYPALLHDLGRRRAAGERVGVGLAAFVEKSGLGPYEGVRMSVGTDGTVRVMTGVASVGQGIETVIAQIVADGLGTDYRKVLVSHGQTDELPHGFGAFATRATVMAGSAGHHAALAVKAKAIDVAAELLEAAPADLELVDGAVRVRGTPTVSLTLGEIAAALDPSGARRLGMAPGLAAESWFEMTHMTYPYGVHLAVVRVDADTGHVEVLRYVVGYDVGRAINPVLVEGQICGGAVQGLGGTLLEAFRFDQLGQPLATSFMDYLLPTMGDVPTIEVLLTEDAPSPLNPLGVKGAGEGGTNGVGAAVASALDDALGLPGAISRLPVTPAEIRALCRQHTPIWAGSVPNRDLGGIRRDT
jgi:aerobic carbon-monoxide dehydrogenase large subunit